ncbi:MULTISPECIES: FAD-binding protein [unclassified Sphingomonas]|uniref:FAD-binding protein n=1 Tax=unclassified Sphingomonas TaxID=196159 RepID=UPI0009E8597C|nr:MULTISPECIES: FAD-binding protein [unclassified Sphingomonas]
MTDPYDFIIVGSGAASVCAALVAREAGKRPLIIEKSDKFGGTTALSGGVMWIPNSTVMARAGAVDSEEAARRYLDACAGDPEPASTLERRAAYLREARLAILFLEQQGMEFTYSDGWSDYYEGEYPGAMARGRSIEAKIFNLRRLGESRHRLRRPEKPLPPVSNPEVIQLTLNGRTWTSKRAFLTVALRMLRNKLGQEWVRMGAALQARLLEIALREKIDIWYDAPLQDLVLENGKIAGVVIVRNGEKVTVQSRHGVLLNAGGFSQSDEMRRTYQRPSTSRMFSAANPGDTGEVISIAMNSGAATAMMDEAWWIPTSRLADGTVLFNVIELARPHCMLVDSRGARFVNEAGDYCALGHAMFNRSKSVSADPSWAILDHQHRSRYWWGLQPPGAVPKEWLESGYMIRADSLEELAQCCGLEIETLRSSVDRFNAFAAVGVDEDFHRGRGALSQYLGDTTSSPNPSLGAICKPPFYAVRIHAGDGGTCGGLLTDELARVLNDAGLPIPGLYATGNTTATVMGRSCPGSGATIGPSLTFGYIAARHASGTNIRD